MRMNEKPNQLSGVQIYCNCLEEVKQRIETVQAIVNKRAQTDAFGHKRFLDEFLCLQIRNILELIAFGSMSSNIALYQREFQKYRGDWNAKRILENLERINPQFYPEPLKQSPNSIEGQTALEVVTDGFLTKSEFIFLYNTCSKMIHSPNPFRNEREPDFKRTIDDWMHRIASLLWFHQMKLIEEDCSWLIYLVHPETKRSHAIKTVPNED